MSECCSSSSSKKTGGCCGGAKTTPAPASSSCCSGKTSPSSSCSTEANKSCCSSTETKASGCCGGQAKATSCCGGPTKSSTSEEQRVYQSVQNYYGKELKKSSDLKTSACCTLTPPHPEVARILRKIPSEVLDKYYGCGNAVPFGLEGLDVLDLGSGSGRDCYIVSAMVGPKGSSTGIDMTLEQLEVAERNIDEYTERLGYEEANLMFVQGYIECLEKAGIKPSSKDMVISNCVINLSPAKEQVLSEAYKVLRDGGELHFSDVYANRRIPEELKKHDVLLGECISGALYVEDFKAMCRDLGFGEPRVLTSKPFDINNAELRQLVGFAEFSSITFRCFKVPHMEAREHEEDYGHVATYLGTIPEYPFAYDLDTTHRFETRRPVRVGGNTAAILKHSWLSKYFKVEGDWSEHFGRFDQDALAAASCGQAPAAATGAASSCSTGGGCC